MKNSFIKYQTLILLLFLNAVTTVLFAKKQKGEVKIVHLKFETYLKIIKKDSPSSYWALRAHLTKSKYEVNKTKKLSKLLSKIKNRRNKFSNFIKVNSPKTELIRNNYNNQKITLETYQKETKKENDLLMRYHKEEYERLNNSYENTSKKYWLSAGRQYLDKNKKSNSVISLDWISKKYLDEIESNKKVIKVLNK